MVAYSHLSRRRGRTGHVPQIKSSVLCLGRDSYPGCAVVGAVINGDGVAAGVLSAPMDVFVLPDCKNFSAVRSEEGDVRPALHSEVGIALVCDRQIALQQDLHPALSGRGRTGLSGGRCGSMLVLSHLISRTLPGAQTSPRSAG